MSVRFIGDTEWRQAQQIEWHVDFWGVDRGRILYRGRSTGKDAFENKLKKWQEAAEWPGMKLAGWQSVIITPSFPGVELELIGFKNAGNIPDPKPHDGFAVHTASGSGVDTILDKTVSGTFTYKAARTTWTWFETSLPSNTPKHATVRRPINPLARENILAYSIEDDEGRPQIVNMSSFVAVFNSLVTRVVVSSYDIDELVPGELYACRTEVDYKVL